MKILYKWLQKKRDHHKAKAIERGFDYAAGELLRGTSVEWLRDQSSFLFEQRTGFDAGIDLAINKAIDKKWVEE